MLLVTLTVLIEGEHMKVIKYMVLLIFMMFFIFIKHIGTVDEEDNLKKHMPDICLYNSNQKISEVIEIKARSESQVMGIIFVNDIHDSLNIKKYYEKKLNEKDWRFIKQEDILNNNGKHVGDRFYYEKDQYEFILVIYPFVTNKASGFQLEMLLGGKKPRYYIYIKKKSSNVTALNEDKFVQM